MKKIDRPRQFFSENIIFESPIERFRLHPELAAVDLVIDYSWAYEVHPRGTSEFQRFVFVGVEKFRMKTLCKPPLLDFPPHYEAYRFQGENVVTGFDVIGGRGFLKIHIFLMNLGNARFTCKCILGDFLPVRFEKVGDSLRGIAVETGEEINRNVQFPELTADDIAQFS